MKRLPLAALHEREFRLFFSGQLISLLGDAVTPFALAWAILDIGTRSDLGYVLAAKTIPLVGFLLVGGVFADRLPRRSVMLTADMVRLLTQGATAALLLTHTVQIWHLIVLQFISGVATAFFNPASTGLTPMTVSAEHLQEANALRGMSMAAMGLVGPAIAGVLIVGVGAGWALAIDAASFGASAIFLALLHLPAHMNLPSQSFLHDLLEGWREFTARTWVWVIVVGASLGNMMGGMMSVLATAYVKDNGGAGAWTLVLVLGAVGGLVGGTVALRVRPKRPLLYGTIALAPLPLPLVLLATGSPYWAIAIAFLISGVSNMLFNTIWETTLQQHVPAAALSRVSAYDWFGSLLCMPLGFAIAGPLAAAVGLATSAWIGVAVYVGSFLLMVLQPSVQQLRSERLDEPALQQIA